MSADDEQTNDETDEQRCVVQKSEKPGVINDELLSKLIRACGLRGEAARLCRGIAIDYAAITELVIEFQNILKIDHIWMCFSLQKLSLKCNKITRIENLDNLKELRELNLSFNLIKSIENLECLRKLEYLSLFQNSIKKIERLDELDALIRLNLGNNFVETTDGIERLRFKTKLYSLNLEGNPICSKQSDFRLYIAAYLPALKYYGYRVISAEEREQGRNIYRNQLRMLEENESEEKVLKEQQCQERKLLEMMRICFMEDLDDNQLFKALFTTFDGTSNEAEVQAYRNRIHDEIHGLYLFCVECHEQRCNEINEFTEALAFGRKGVQLQGIQLVGRFLSEKNSFVAETSKRFHAMHTLVQAAPSNVDAIIKHRNGIDEISANFMAAVDNIWYLLMELETSLLERTTKSYSVFNGVVQAMIESVIEKCNTTFDRIRLACNDYFQSVALKRTGDEDTKNRHLDIFNQRHETMLGRAKKWLFEITSKHESSEYNRNRAKILEINNFIDAQRTEYSQLKDSLYADLLAVSPHIENILGNAELELINRNEEPFIDAS